MTSRNDDDKDNSNMDRNRRQAPRYREQQQPKPRKQKDLRRREATTGAAPVYITIGPQCCGKSSFLRDYKDGAIMDISLDDQQDVYVPIPTATFLHAYDDKSDGTNTVDEAKQLLEQVYQGKTLGERIRENIELILVLRRWNGDSTASDFERRIKIFYEERGYPESVSSALVKAVEDFLFNKPELPRETEVFVLESLFKPHPETRQSAIQRAHEVMRETPRHVPVAWGNTNSKPKDYERVLEICHQTRRPVHFIVCHPTYSTQVANDGNNGSELMTLPWLPLEELLKRNLHRLQSQGKFVPANAISDCCQRVTALIPPNLLEAECDETKNKKIEEHLVAIVSDSNGGMRPRRQDNRRSIPNFRYSLSKHRLIQKEYSRNDADKSSSQHGRNNQEHGARRYNDGRDRRYTDGRDPRRRHLERYDDRRNDGRRYGGEDGNRNNRYLGHQPPNREDAPTRSRRRYNDANNDNMR